MTLFDIKDYLDSLVESFASLLDLELTVINSDPLHRISGTGFYRVEHPDILRDYWQHSYTHMCIEQARPLVIFDTSEYTSLIPAKEQEHFSRFYSVLLHPILCQKKAIGAIVLASFNEVQQHLLMAKKDRLMDYLARTAELISLKLEQEQMMQQTETVNRQLSLMNETYENGVLLYSVSAGIQQMNEHARSFLHMEEEKVSGVLVAETLKIAQTADQTRQKYSREIFHSAEGHSYFLTVQAQPLNNAAHDVLCIIMPFAQVQDTILQHTGGQIAGDEIVATSPVMRQLVERIKTVAWHTSNMLILGESGTGKEMFARMIHANSSRKDNPFVSINCAAIPEALLESELFGYEEGAFTGAKKGGRIGKFMLADKGTLFLDEIGDMPLYLQAKLLRVLSERKVDRVGGATPVDVDVRIVAATNRNLEEMIHNREFREDLYYRLCVIPFEIPPLRQRKDDVVALIKHFMLKYNQKLDKHIEGITDRALDLLVAYSWPGNVRELENCLEYMMNFEPGARLTIASMPPKILHALHPETTLASTPEKPFVAPAFSLRPLKDMLHEFETALFTAFLEQHHNRPALADIDRFCDTLQISRATYYRKWSEQKSSDSLPSRYSCI